MPTTIIGKVVHSENRGEKRIKFNSQVIMRVLEILQYKFLEHLEGQK